MARVYSPVDVRDARLIHQLRQAGHRITSLRDLLPVLRTTGARHDTLTDREHSIRTRSRALMNATLALVHCVNEDLPADLRLRPVSQSACEPVRVAADDGCNGHR